MSPVKVNLKSWASALIVVMGIWGPHYHLGCIHDLFITFLASLSPEEDPALAPGSICLCSLWGLQGLTSGCFSWLEGSQMLEAAVHTLGKPFFSSLWRSLLADQLLLLLLLPDMWGPRVGARLLRDPLIKYLHRWLGPKPWWCVLKVLTTHQPSGYRHVGFWFLACGFCFYEAWRSGAWSFGPSQMAGCCVGETAALCGLVSALCAPGSLLSAWHPYPLNPLTIFWVGWIMSSKKWYVHVLTPGICGFDLIWQWGLCKCTNSKGDIVLD